MSMNPAPIVIAIAQINPTVGDIGGNTDSVLRTYQEHAASSDAVLFPELVLSGYPPEDLLLRPSLDRRLEQALQKLAMATTGNRACLVVGYPRRHQHHLYNCAGVFQGGRQLAEYRKQCLPNYQVFDEKRYFSAGEAASVFTLRGWCVGLTICEDIWHPGPARQAVAQGAQLIFNLNASPFHSGKQAEREAVLAQRVRETGVPIVYVNMVGGQDELVFDGGSCIVDAQQQVCFRAPMFREEVMRVELSPGASGTLSCSPSQVLPQPEWEEALYQSLVLGLRDYVGKNGFSGVVLGLSGGIDSALTLAIAVDALGADRVEAVMMPFRYTAAMSVQDAREEALRLGVRYTCLSIESLYDMFLEVLKGEFAGKALDKTEENLQARIRGVLLMAISNKRGSLVLTTGNKSEMAVGYCTLYGDMVGGFAVLKDVFKTRVYALATYRNRISPVIPQRVIDRPPSAELAPGQKDQDSLPPYEILDAILSLYVEQDQSAEDIVARGFDATTVYRVIRLVDLSEYKRRQSAVGPRVTEKGFGRDRRYPITSGWEAGI